MYSRRARRVRSYRFRRRRYAAYRSSRAKFQRQRRRTRAALRRGGNFFARLYEQRNLVVTNADAQTYGHLFQFDITDTDNVSQVARFKRLANLFEEYKVHKVAVKITPHANVGDHSGQVGPYAVAPYFLPNDVGNDQNATIADKAIRYENVAGLPNSKIIDGHRGTNLVFVPKVYRAVFPTANADTGVTPASSEMVPTNRIWQTTKFLYPASSGTAGAPYMYGLAMATQGISLAGTITQITYTVDVFYYVTFRKFKNYMTPV